MGAAVGGGVPVTIGRRRVGIGGGGRGRSVAVYAFAGMNPFELGCVIEVFGLARPELGLGAEAGTEVRTEAEAEAGAEARAGAEVGVGVGVEVGVSAKAEGEARQKRGNGWYEFKVCAETRGPMPVVGGMSIAAEYGLEEFASADTLIVTAVPDVRGSVSPALVSALQLAHARGARIVSICSGAFALAEAGLLDGREATTHWQYADLLARRFPAVRVNPGVLYVDGGQVLTSAGSAAGLDLCLHLVRLDYGAAVANSVARRLVLPPHRDGGQAQFIEGGVRPVDASDGGVARSMAWAVEHLAERIAVADLARVAVMSERTYVRQFTRVNGTSPLRWLVGQRVAAARALLETAGGASVEEIGAAVGMADPAGFRRHFARVVGAPPSAYRRSFYRDGGERAGGR